jgi:hypothetical protein
MRRPLAALVSSLVLALAAPAIAQDRDGGGEQAMLDAINAQRAQAGVTALVRDARLDAAAARHSAEMAAHDVLEHVSSGSGTPADRVQHEGLSIGEIAENVAMHTTTADAQRSLEASDAHLANMVNARFTHVGIASVRDESGFYVTQVYGRIEAAPEAASAPQSGVGSVGPISIPPAIVAPDTTAAAPVAPTAPVVTAPTPQTQTIEVPQASGGAITATVPEGSRATVIVPGVGETPRPVAGYWVCASSRWWYFPMPPNAAPGQQLQADTSVVGAPPGYTSTACTPGTASQVVTLPPPPPVYQARPPVYAPPPVYYPPPRVYYPPPPPPRVYYPPPQRRVLVLPPPPPPRAVIVQPPPGAVIAPYGGGAVLELGIGPRFRLRGSIRRR